MGLFDIFKKKTKEKTKEIKETPVIVEIKVSPCRNEQSTNDDVIRIEDRLKGVAPTCDGLYPHEILVLSYANHFYKNGNSFQGFWWERYGISDVNEILNSLEDRGFICEGTALDAARIENIARIKEILKEYGLKSTGKKEELLERLKDNIDSSELDKKFPKKPYALSETTCSLLKKYEWIYYIHSHFIEGLNIWNLTEMVQNTPDMSYRDIIWKYLNDCCLKYLAKGLYPVYICTRITMARFLMEEDKYEDAFNLLCEVAAYYLKEIPNSPVHNLSEMIESLSSGNMRVVVPPGVTSMVVKIKKSLGWDDDTLKEKAKVQFMKLNYQFDLFTLDESVDIFMYEMNENKEALVQMYLEGRKRLKTG